MHFFMGPNGKRTNRHDRYALSDKGASAIIVSPRFLDTEQQHSELFCLVASKHYKLSNRATNETGILIPEWVLDSANCELEKAEGMPLPDDCGTHIYLHVAGPRNYADPYILRKFGGVTYIWSDKKKWWCLAGGYSTSPQEPTCGSGAAVSN